MPDYAWMYPIPYEMYEKYSIRRYGAHGTSHRYVAGEMCKILRQNRRHQNHNLPHRQRLSISAVKDGKVIDTSMGFTPLDGVEMGTRCGSIDRNRNLHNGTRRLHPRKNVPFMNKECGMLGVSGISSDSRDIEAAILKGDKRATLAANILAYQIKKYIGSYTAAMKNGLDAIASSPPAWAKTTPNSANASAATWNTSESNSTTNSTPSAPAKHREALHRGLQGTGLAHPDQRRTRYRVGYRKTR